MTAAPWPPRSDEAYLAEARQILGEELLGRFQAVQALVFDADGVLTSGHLVYGPEGEAFKEFHSRDGLGLVLARVAGIKLAVLTGRQSEIVACRARELRFDAIRLGRFDKVVALREILDEVGCRAEQALFMGDDLVDLPALLAVAVPVAVPGAPPEVRDHCAYVTRAGGGNGAVREITELVLKSQGLYGRVLAELAGKAWQVRPKGQQ